MAGTAFRKEIVARGPALALNSPFGRYKPEESYIVRKQEVKPSKGMKTVENLKRLYHRTIILPGPEFGDDAFHRFSCALRHRAYTAADIERFSVAIVEFQQEYRFSTFAGIFLSALMNPATWTYTHRDKDYTIQTAHLDIPLSYLGQNNTKNILVNGNTGACVGQSMNGGSIRVVGDAGAFVGHEMRGGIITVAGNAGEGVGTGMWGGEIHIEGEIGSLGTGFGKIFHKGKLIMDR